MTNVMVQASYLPQYGIYQPRVSRYDKSQRTSTSVCITCILYSTCMLLQENGKLNLEDTSNAIVVTHCLAMRAADYWKRASVMRITTSDWHTLLLQAKLVE